jgi:secreted trypsin-like serine protease
LKELEGSRDVPTDGAPRPHRPSRVASDRLRQRRSPVRVVSFRERLMADSQLVNLGSANNAGFNLQTQGNGKDEGGTCSGDSGGPIFYPRGSNQIVAVTSFGMNANCRGVDLAYRLDRPAVLDWIAALD